MKKLFKVNISKMYVAYLLLLTIFIVGTYSSYAYFTVNKEKKNAIRMVTGNLVGELKVDEEINDKLVVDANTSKSFSIELINKNERSARFNFYYKGSLKEGVEVGYIQNDGYNTMPSESGVILTANGTLGYYQKYRIKVKNNTSDSITIPLGYNVGLDYNDLTLPTDCHLFGEMKINPNEPKLASNMIPVRYDGSNWVKADKNSWYNYNEQEWANAVTVSSDVRDGYIKADAGATIEMDKIDTMWVWIPRYSYTIGSEDGNNYYGKKGEFLDTAPTQVLPGEIDVEFVDKNTKERGSAKYKVSEGVSGWYTPDAFTFGNEELEGIWIGKFETSNKENNSSDSDSLTPIIKPKVTSWRSIRVSTLESVALKVNKDNNIYGFSESEVDSHAMKGSEWALAAYLSQSKYGKLGNRSYSGTNKEVYMNAYTGHRTGCSYGGPTFPNGSGETTCSHEYDELEDRGEGQGAAGAGASTTGNIYGIYDMNGGAWEYVMSNYNGNTEGYTGNTESLNSGYNGLLTDGTKYEKGIPYPAEKYYDKYLSASTDIKSHAMGETAGWYGDYSTMVSSTYPWQIRGGGWGNVSVAGVFCFDYTSQAGAARSGDSFRLVLVNS